MQSAAEILDMLPSEFDIVSVREDHPIAYAESMNQVLQLEVQKYNRLDKKDKEERSFHSECHSRHRCDVKCSRECSWRFACRRSAPSLEGEVAYPCTKKLSAWVEELLDRLNFIRKWIDGGKPSRYWLGGFFFPHAFLTGTLQNFARKHVMAIDTIGFSFKVVGDIASPPPAEGVHVYGMFLEGARFDNERKCLDESQPKLLFSPAPSMWFKPRKKKKEAPVWHVLVSGVSHFKARRQTLDDRPLHQLCAYDRPAQWGRRSALGEKGSCLCVVKVINAMPCLHIIAYFNALLL